jgi:hypothetical protein
MDGAMLELPLYCRGDPARERHKPVSDHARQVRFGIKKRTAVFTLSTIGRHKLTPTLEIASCRVSRIERISREHRLGRISQFAFQMVFPLTPDS